MDEMIKEICSSNFLDNLQLNDSLRNVLVERTIKDLGIISDWLFYNYAQRFHYKDYKEIHGKLKFKDTEEDQIPIQKFCSELKNYLFEKNQTADMRVFYLAFYHFEQLAIIDSQRAQDCDKL